MLSEHFHPPESRPVDGRANAELVIDTPPKLGMPLVWTGITLESRPDENTTTSEHYNDTALGNLGTLKSVHIPRETRLENRKARLTTDSISDTIYPTHEKGTEYPPLSNGWEFVDDNTAAQRLYRYNPNDPNAMAQRYIQTASEVAYHLAQKQVPIRTDEEGHATDALLIPAVMKMMESERFADFLSETAQKASLANGNHRLSLSGKNFGTQDLMIALYGGETGDMDRPSKGLIESLRALMLGPEFDAIGRAGQPNFGNYEVAYTQLCHLVEISLGRVGFEDYTEERQGVRQNHKSALIKELARELSLDKYHQQLRDAESPMLNLPDIR